MLSLELHEQCTIKAKNIPHSYEASMPLSFISGALKSGNPYDMVTSSVSTTIARSCSTFHLTNTGQ